MALQWGLLGVILLISGQVFVTTAQANVCKTFGSGVIQTFNKSMFYLKSTCPFTLTRFTLSGVDCGITVQRNETGLISRVEISVNKITTILQDGKVTVEGNSISLPFDHTYQLVYQYGVFIKLRSKVLPFSVIWRSHPDSISSLWVELDHELMDGMTGMCGRLNSTETIDKLISASVMSDGKCLTGDAESQRPQVCEVLSYAVGCHGGKSAVNTYIDLCLLMPSNVHTYAKCSFFEEIARMCGNQSSWWSEQREETSCPLPTCPGEMKYHELGPAFPPTCTNPEPPSGPLISTCLPPSGMVLNDRADGFLCINIQECLCVHGGKTYPPGAERNSKCQSCVCVQGKWNCSANVCPPTCNMEGRFVTTFDGKQYRVPGKCTYVAASGTNWTVTVRYSDTDASIAEMHLDVSKDKYTFSTNSVKRGQDEITDLSQTDHTMVFWQSSMFVQVQTYFGMKIKVQVSPEIQLYLYLPPSEQTRGLCGIYNNDTEDDFTTSSGIVENAALPFTQSWTIGQCSPPNTDLCINTDNEKFAEQKCSQLRNTSSAFARCHDYVPVSSFFDACVQRTCKCTSGVQNCLCVALSNYAKACASQGIDIGDWRAESACSVTCSGNLRFSYIMSACNHTCRSLTGPDPTCDAVADPVEGCGCLAGTHLNTPQECSSSALCVCHYQGGTTPPGPVVIDGRQCLCEHGVLRCSQACDCPQGKICVHCAQAAVNTSRRTCESLSKPSSVEETCSSGCYCPAGLIENHSGGCVTQDNCTCKFSGSVYASGQTVVTNCKKCTCRAGQWHCEGEPCPGVCEVFGNGQYNTFDSKWYRFDGNCQYTLVEDDHGLFAVRVESVPCCDEALTCSRSILVDLQDVVTLTLRDMNVTQTLKAGWHLQAKPLYSVHTVGLYIIISVPDLGLTVIWDKHTRVTIVLQARWKGNVRGLCGNYDGVVTNDLLTRSSSLVFSTLEFGNSWKTAVPPCSDVTQEVFPCERHSYCEAWAQRRCMILRGDTFTDCHLKVDPAPYYQACILESCSCEFEGRFLGFCTAVAAYAEACTAQNACINWRTPDLCPVYCDYYNEERENGWHYEPCGWIKTCGKTHSFTGSLEGCYPRCPVEAPYFDENTRKCSSLDRCTCFFNNTVVNPGDEVRTSSECCKCTEGQLICENCVFTTTQTTRSTSQPITTTTTTMMPTTERPSTTEPTTTPPVTTVTEKVSTTEKSETTTLLTTTSPVTKVTITTTTEIPSTTKPTTQPVTTVTERFSTTEEPETTTLLTTTSPVTKVTITTTTEIPSTTKPTTPPVTTVTERFSTTEEPETTTLLTTTSPVTTVTITTTTEIPSTTKPTTPPVTTVTEKFSTTEEPETTTLLTTTSPVTKVTITTTTEIPSTTKPTTPPVTTVTERFSTTEEPETTTLLTTTSPVTTVNITTTTEIPSTTNPTTPPVTTVTERFSTTEEPETTTLLTTTSPVTTVNITTTTEIPSTTKPTTPPVTTVTEKFSTTEEPETTTLLTTTSPVTTVTITTTTEIPSTTKPTTPPVTTVTERFSTTEEPETTTLLTTTSPVTTVNITTTTEIPSTTKPTTPPVTTVTERFSTTEEPETTTPLTTTLPVTTVTITTTTEIPSTTKPTTPPLTTVTERFSTTEEPETTTLLTTTSPVTTVNITTTTEIPSTTKPTTPPVTTVTEKFSTTEEPETTTLLTTTSPVTKVTITTTTEIPSTTKPTTPPVTTVTERFSTTEEPETTTLLTTTSPVTTVNITTTTEIPSTTKPTTPPVTTVTEKFSTTEEPETTTLLTTTSPVTTVTITTTTEIPSTTKPTTPPVTTVTERFSTTEEPETTTLLTTTSPVTTVNITTTTEIPSTTKPTTPPVTTVTERFSTTEEPETTTPLTTTLPVTTVTITTTTEIPSTTKPTTSPLTTVTERFSTTEEPETTTLLTTTSPVTTVNITTTTEIPSTTKPTTPPVTTVTERFSTTEEPETTTLLTTTSPVTTVTITTTTEIPSTTNPTTSPVTTVTERFSTTEEPETTTLLTTTSPVTTVNITTTTEIPSTTKPTTPPVTTVTERFSTTEEPETTTPLTTTLPVTTVTITTTTEIPSTTKPTTPPLTTVTERFSTTEEPETTTPLTTTSPVTTVTITTTERPSTTILTTPLTTTSPVTTVTITTTTEIPSTTTTPPVITGPTLIMSTSHQHTEICRDPLRNQSWSSGAVWTEDCFHKTCKNSIIEMRPVICPTLAPPVCPRDLKRVVKDEQGCCKTWKCDCQCDLYGDPHYVSFSGTRFNFLDNCTYTLVKEKNPRHQLSITVDNYFSYPRLFGSSVKGIILKYHNDTVTLRVNDDYKRVEAFLNQIPVQPPYKQNGIRFESTNYQVFVYLDQIRSHVSLDPENTLQITLAMEYFLNNTVGQCGVCGGPSCVRRNGQVEKENCCERTAYDWIEEDPLKPYCSHAPKNKPCTPPPSTPAPICNAPLCDLLTHKVFRECSQSVDVETLLRNCRLDYCIVKTNSSICSSLRHLSEQCQRLGVCVHWRNLTMGICDVPCPEGMVFDECRSTPNDVCKGGVRVPGNFGTDSMRSGCFCPNNQSLAEEYKTKCVSECTNCKGPLGEPMPVGAIWESNCHICRCNNQTLTEECSPMRPSPTPICSEDSTPVSGCCNNQICVKKTCEYNGKTYKVGDTWRDPSQPCVTFSCTRTGTEIKRSVCPEQSCSEELRVWDEHHCCFSCNVTCAVRVSNMTVTVEGCTQEVKIPSCEGHCPSNSMWVRSGELEPDRRCCRKKRSETRMLSLSCNGAAPTQYTYNHILSCECQSDI